MMLWGQDLDSLRVPSKTKFFFLKGYLNGLYIPVYIFGEKGIQNTAWIHNRLNFIWLPASHWDFTAELRTRALFQDFRGYSSEQMKMITQDAGWLNLSWNLVKSNYMMLTTAVERLYVAYQTDHFSVKVGRQRINWSQALLFNPNDIFNGYSFFDYDYPERQGSDAIRLSAFPTSTSAVELAAKMNYYGQLTLAGLYRFNVKGWDLQMLGGMVDKYDLMLGTGFSSDIKGVNLRGEFSYYYSTTVTPELKNTFVASFGVDYYFKNSILLSVEGLYNRLPKNYITNFRTLYTVPMSPKYLSITEWTVCAQISFPFLPILTGSFAALSFINLPAFYLGPSLDFSALNNLTLSAMLQTFIGDKKTMEPQGMLIGYLRLKWNF
jgi:hypothetical protein